MIDQSAATVQVYLDFCRARCQAVCSKQVHACGRCAALHQACQAVELGGPCTAHCSLTAEGILVTAMRRNREMLSRLCWLPLTACCFAGCGRAGLSQIRYLGGRAFLRCPGDTLAAVVWCQLLRYSPFSSGLLTTVTAIGRLFAASCSVSVAALASITSSGTCNLYPSTLQSTIACRAEPGTKHCRDHRHSRLVAAAGHARWQVCSAAAM